MELVDQDIPGPRRVYPGYGRRQPKVVWPNDAKLVLSLCINHEEGSEYSHAAGDGRNEGLAEIPYSMPDEYRDLAVESVYEYGSRAGVFRLMRLFDEYKIDTTWFAAAVAIERNPEVGEWIQETGRVEVCSHGWRWSEHWLFSREEEAERIRWAIESFTKTCGQRPVGWYCRYGPSVNTRELLVEEGGFLYDSDAYNDDLPYFTEVRGKRHLVVPYSFTYNDARFILPQGSGGPADWADLCVRGIDELLREGRAGQPKMMSIGLHPRWIGQAARTSALREVIEHALGQGDVAFMQRRHVAQWWLDHHEEWAR
ncbi:MAG: allantoinase [Actinobacteria bacterium]|nr:allantoinase [Actinomycetota bacterium]